MPPSRSDTSSGSVPVHLLVILTLPVVLSFFWIHDAPACGNSKKHSSVRRSSLDLPAKGRIQDFPICGPVGGDFSFSPLRDPNKFLLQPASSMTSLKENRPFSFWLGDDPISGLFEDKAKTSGERRPPLLYPRCAGNGKDESSVTIRRRASEPSSEPPAIVVPLKTTLASGAIYQTASEESAGGFTMDFVLPARLGSSSSVFFESRVEYLNQFSGLPRWADHRFDLDLGLGWRKIWDNKVMLGANAFWDSSLLNGGWYSSPGFGIEFAWALSPGIWDITLNVYRGGGIDLETGYTFPMLQDRLDMRLYAEKYRFFDGEFILGSKGGVEISSPGRLLAVSYEYGEDSRNRGFHAINCSLTVPFSFGRLCSGKNPFELPVLPRSRDARNVQRLQSDRVKRSWSSPDTVVEARHTPQGKRWTTPGRLTDTIFKPTKPAPPTKTAKAKSDDCGKPRFCTRHYRECSESDETKKDKSFCGGLIGWLLSGVKEPDTGGTAATGVLGAICLTGATYLTGNYAYRNTFGPFELEPYEVARIKKEMPNIHRRK